MMTYFVAMHMSVCKVPHADAEISQIMLKSSTVPLCLQ